MGWGSGVVGSSGNRGLGWWEFKGGSKEVVGVKG